MSTRSQGLTKLIALRLRILKKRLTIKKETDRRGGPEVRRELRDKRLVGIRAEKLRLRDGLITSWSLGEIPPPTPEEKKEFWLYYNSLTLAYMREVQKKYWKQ